MLHQAGTASFDMSFVAPVRINNTNFGPYKYDETNITFSCSGVVLGQVTVPEGKVKFRMTKKVDLTVTLNSSTPASTSLNTSLRMELSSGTPMLSSSGKMTGKVELVKISLQQKKSINMDCTTTITVSTRTLQSLLCK